MGILNDLGKLVERDIEDIEGEEVGEEQPTFKKVADKVVDDEEDDDKASGGDIGEILKHIDNVTAAAEFIDTLTTDQADSNAFEAEVSLRKALQKMKNLADESYKKKGK
jgi:hypothetical protein